MFGTRFNFTDYSKHDLHDALRDMRNGRKQKRPRNKPKIANLLDIHKAMFGWRKPKPETMVRTDRAAAHLQKVGVGPDGRLYTIHPRDERTGMEIGTPRGWRWQDGKLVQRRAR